MKTYGAVQFDAAARSWVINAVPHVSLRLKRVFGKLGKHKIGHHVISDTPENAQDLAWFIQRYPMEVTGRERLDKQAQRHQDGLSIVEQIMAGVYVPAEAKELALPPRQYQAIAAAMARARGGLLLADDVGLGKTCSAICVLADPSVLPAVVVTLAHLPRQWRAEIERFAPWLRTHIIKTGSVYDLTTEGRKRQPKSLNLFAALPDVVLINYHKLAGWAETLVKLGYKTVIYDECQELRNNDSAKYSAAKLISDAASLRLGLSATPIYNYGNEFHSVIECLSPGELGTREEFCTEWCAGSGEKAKIVTPKAFGSYLRDSGIMLRRTRSDVGRELPGVQKIPYMIDSDRAALDRVKGTCAELAKLILAETEAVRGSKMRAAEELSNTVRQATGISKAPFVADFVRLLLETGEKVVLYAWHRSVYDILISALQEFKPALYTGSESSNQKDESKRRFMAGETNLFIISLRSGAGLDGLQTVCRTVVFAELDWSPGCHEQNIGRVYRDGQDQMVAAYFLYAEEGSDPIMLQVLGIKGEQIEGVRREPGEDDVVEKLQNDGSHIRKLAELYLSKTKEREAKHA